MNLPFFVIQFIEFSAILSAAVAALVSLLSARTTIKHKKTLSKIALEDPLITAELVKFYHDSDLSEAEVRAIVRAISKAIERIRSDATDDVKIRLQGAESLVNEEKKTRGHRLFKELAAQATSKLHLAA